MTRPTPTPTRELPRWSVADVHESLTRDRSSTRWNGRRRRRPARGARSTSTASGPSSHDRSTAADGDGRRRGHRARYNDVADDARRSLGAVRLRDGVDRQRDEHAQALLSELEAADARVRPLLARLADWVDGARRRRARRASATTAASTVGPLLRLAERAAHQMTEAEEGLYAELSHDRLGGLGPAARATSRRSSPPRSRSPTAHATLPMTAVRGLATDADPAVRRAAYDAELAAWPTVAVPVAAAMNAIKGEANIVNRRRALGSRRSTRRCSPTASSRPTFDAMQAAVVDVAPRLPRAGCGPRPRAARPRRRRCRGGTWSRRCRSAPPTIVVGRGHRRSSATRSRRTAPRSAGSSTAPLDERWIDAEPRDGKRGGAFCMPFVGDRSLVLLNWTGTRRLGADARPTSSATPTTTRTLADRTPLQRRLPMALAETASIFCETLVVEAGLAPPRRATSAWPCSTSTCQGATQVVVDIHCRFLFETEVFARRQRRTLGVGRAVTS